jgi:eukaryotic-like serine/threonine-protein kinase
MMALDPGTRLGPYEVLSMIGAGGMGEVYKAADTRLNRTVAIKVLPPHFSDDGEMKQRFEREAQTIASLNHPNICILHDVGREAETDFLVMEYLEGQTLAQRIERGPLPLEEALNVALAILDALEKAHAQGVVHRDLKPSNVMLSSNGVKLLDFGLAKLKSPEPPVAPAGRVPRGARVDATAPGLILGTLQYMAPEQLEGAEADARTDIFAFGSIFYEMVTGRRAFEGKNQPLLIAAILTLDLDPLSKLQPESPPALDHVIKRCLAKDPDDRWQTAHDLLIQLRWITEGGAAGLIQSSARKRERRMLLVLAAVVFLGAVLSAPAYLYFRGPVETDALQFRVPVAGLSESDIALSPDGRIIALVARPNTQEPKSLFVRMVGATTFRRLGGTDDASQPFWSPDSRSIAFEAGGRLKKVDASGGAPKDLGPAPSIAGGSWGSEGTILFGSEKGLYRVSAEGGNPASLTTVEKPETGHFWPAFLPDGNHYLYLAWSAEPGSRAIYAGALNSKEKTKLMPADSNVAYAAPGYLLFHRETTLFAQPFNAKNIALTGDPVHIADQLWLSPMNGRGSFDVSQNGALIYFQNAGRGSQAGRAQAQPQYQFAWRDRMGNQIALAGDEGTYGDIDLSPDGKRIAVTRQDTAAADIWVIDWERAGVAQQLTLDPGDDINPVWAQPNGDRIAFTTFRKGNADIYIKNANGASEEKPLLESPNNEYIEDWSKDGRFITYKLGQGAFEDIYAQEIKDGKAEGKPIPVVVGPYHKDEPQFSYDGKWLAYTSDESGGTYQVYVIPFPPDGVRKITVSKNGGGQPRWRGDGKELFFRSPDNGIMAADMNLAANLSASIPHLLFVGLNSAVSREPTRHQWAVTPNGQRFLIRVAPGQGQRGGPNLGGMPGVPPQFPGVAGQPGVAAQGGLNFVSSGLTVLRNWPALFKKGAQ